ncbi:MAG: UbiA prenyltransferase family protein [Flavobacteriaceae bacterium]|nr:UbiA prenyltransferase family protein [Flavobacteriaceae bacterium]
MLIFLPGFFGGVLQNKENFGTLCFVFFFFSITASMVYVFNDLLDIEKDKLHPDKKKRPLASGAISKRKGIIIFIVMLLTLIGTSYFFKLNVLVVTFIYFAINVMYTIKLKEIPILELFIVASGFVFRILIGGTAIDVEPSKWILMLTFFSALYIVISKRRGELFNNEIMTSRVVLKHYSLEFLNLAMALLVTISIMSYIMYTVEPIVISRFSTDKIYLTSFIVIFILLRHLQQSLVYNNTESPVAYFFKDKANFIAIVVWLITFYILIYI